MKNKEAQKMYRKGQIYSIWTKLLSEAFQKPITCENQESILTEGYRLALSKVFGSNNLEWLTNKNNFKNFIKDHQLL